MWEAEGVSCLALALVPPRNLRRAVRALVQVHVLRLSLPARVLEDLTVLLYEIFSRSRLRPGLGRLLFGCSDLGRLDLSELAK